jgi:hypothetical protein
MFGFVSLVEIRNLENDVQSSILIPCCLAWWRCRTTKERRQYSMLRLWYSSTLVVFIVVFVPGTIVARCWHRGLGLCNSLCELHNASPVALRSFSVYQRIDCYARRWYTTAALLHRSSGAAATRRDCLRVRSEQKWFGYRTRRCICKLSHHPEH